MFFNIGQSTSSSTLSIPASPFMRKLGYGTGVNVYLMKRYVILIGVFQHIEISKTSPHRSFSKVGKNDLTQSLLIGCYKHSKSGFI